tara:strand:- start:469 stop:903 length:435 start_codon:yes stop_codon:yes gene_type:complete
MTKANEQQQEKYRGGVVPMDDIEKHSPTLRQQCSKVTDAQAELVHMILHNGCNPTEAADAIGRNKAWAYNTLNKQHVIDYRQQLAMMTLGWDATQAMATMRELLGSKSQYVRLEAAKDLMDRAGFRNDAPRTPSTAVQINFNVD